MNKFSYTTVLFLSTMLFSCDLSEEDVAPDPQGNYDPVNVLADGSGFTHVFDEVRLLTSASSLEPTIGVHDYTIESNNKLHIAYYHTRPTQQDNFVNSDRVSVDIDTKQEIALPAGADTLGYSPVSLAQQGRFLVLQQFRPYSNFFTYATTTNVTGSNKIEYSGDVTGVVGPNANPIGTADFGFRFPVTSISVGPADNAFSWFLPGIPNPTYTLSGTSSQPFNFFNNSGKPIMTSFSESDIFTYGSFRTILVRPDSIIAYSLNDALTSRTKKSGLAITGLATGTNIETLRHYSSNGKVLGLLIKDLGQKKYWTYSYNFDTQILTQGATGVTLDFSGDGTDVDIDELGNLYYSGFAANGSNTTGVSIYKKDVNGTVSVVGKDDFLKFGTIVKLKYLNSKLYVAVTGKQTNTSNYQLSILKQD